MSDTAPARVRFAPSPTGRFHLGSARSALYDFLYARQTEGQFVLRIKVTDRKKFDPNAEGELIEGLPSINKRKRVDLPKTVRKVLRQLKKRLHLYHERAE